MVPVSWLIAICGALALAVAWFLLPFCVRKSQERKLKETCARRNAVVLTYDDGPGEILTPRLLDLLKKHQVHATFYALGRNIEKHPELVQRALAEGHDVGSHTYNHSNAWKTDPFTAAMDLSNGIRITKQHGGDKFAFRPPYGKLTLPGLIQGYMRGLKYGWWSIDSRDSWARRPVNDVVDEIARLNGGVILMHDYDSYEKSPSVPSHPDHVLALTEAIIGLAKLRGLRIVPLSTLDW